MEKILMQLHQEITNELSRDSAAMESLGTPGHQLKMTLEQVLREVKTNRNHNPFELTNQVLTELNRYHRNRN